MIKPHVLMLIVMIFVCLVILECDADRKEMRIVATADSTVTFELGQFECTVIKDGGTTINALQFFSGVESAAMRPVQLAYPDIGYANDMAKDSARTTRWAFVERAKSEKILVYGCHFPFPGLVYVDEKKGKLVLRQIEEVR